MKARERRIDELAMARRRIAELEATQIKHESVERALQERTHELGERVKELNCLYGISHLVERSGISLEEILQGTVELIPLAWQYPEVTGARIVLEDREYRTENYQKAAACQQVADLIVHGRPSGIVEVCYLEERPESDEGPFLKEERSLLNAIAERLGRVVERIRAQEALKESEEKYRNLFEHANDSIFIIDPPTRRLLDANENAAKRLGYSREELLQLTIDDIDTPRAAARNAEIIRQLQETGSIIFEHAHRRRDGTEMPIEISSQLIEYGDRQVFQSFVRDISKRVRAEREYETILKTALDGFWICDTQGHILEINDSLCQMLGYPREELLTMSISDVEAVETSEEVARHIQVVIENGHDRFESRLRRVDGQIVDTEASVSYMDVAEKRFFAFIRDTSERVRAEEALRIARDEMERRVEERTAELARANETLKKEISERVEAQREIERSQRRESVLNALLRISMTDLSLKEQLDQVLGEILSVPWLPVLRQGAIFLAGDDPDVLELRVQRGLRPELQVTCARVPFGQCICGRAAASGEIEFAERVDERHETTYEGMSPHGHYCVPILSGDRVIGTILLYLKEGHRRDAQEEEFLRAAAHTLGGIIERVRVEEALRQSEKELRALNEQLGDYSRNLESRVAERTREIEQRRQVAESLRDILTILNSDRPLDEILEYIVAEATRLLGSDTSAIYRLQGADEAFRVQTALGRTAESVSQADLPPGLSEALRLGRPVAIPDLTSPIGQVDDLSYPSDSGHGTPPARAIDYCRALLAVPLVVADELYGSLVLYYSGARKFSGEEIRLAVAFSDQAALAIENARLHQRAKGAAVMEERARLARELHDSVTQSLYSLTLLAEGWRRLARAGRLEDTEDSLTELGEIAQQALKEMRLMVHELRPPALEEEGLLGALHHRLGAVERRSGVEARLVAEKVVELPAAMEEELYRIAVEALNNALKHAAATSVSVRLRTDEKRLELEVRDNGRGFDVERSGESQGMGLGNMRERAEKLGGSLALHSAPGQGTRIVVSVPYTDPDGKPQMHTDAHR